LDTTNTNFSFPIRWGIIGLGKIAHKFATDLALVPTARLAAVASRTQKKADTFAGQYGADHSFYDYESLLASNQVDAVYIATPHALHFENTLLALQHRKAVLCEKPFGMNHGQVQEMVKTAKAQNVFLMEGMWTRFFPLIDHTIKQIKGGTIGQVRTLRADFGFHAAYDPESRVFNKSLGGGSLLDVGIYPLFLSLLLLGYPEKIEATASMRENDVDENCFILLHYPGGVKAQLYSSIVTKTAVEATIFGEKGSLHLHSRFHHPRKIDWGSYYEERTVMEDPYSGYGYHYEIAHVNECLHRGLTESPLMTHALSLQLMQLLDAVKSEIGLQYEDWS
jgi:predicted dehydrogenase